MLDSIALAHTSDLDRVYPPMSWTARWSTGDNLAFGVTPAGRFLQAAGMDVPDYRPPGLWLISDEGGAVQVEDLGQEVDGFEVTAWNRREAIARLRALPAP